MTLSVILAFATNDDGWEAIKRGSLLQKTAAPSTGSGHAVLIVGYDFEQDAAICLNSWNARTEQRFNVRFTALHEFYTTNVFFTLPSIHGKTGQDFRPLHEEFLGILDGKTIRSYWMDEQTMIYATTFVCEPEAWRTGRLCFRGYDVDEFIEIKLKRQIGWFAALKQGRRPPRAS
jgi:hypothetical protein